VPRPPLPFYGESSAGQRLDQHPTPNPELDRFCINEMRKWPDDVRLEAFANIMLPVPDARGHRRLVGPIRARMLDRLEDGYGKSWARSERGAKWIYEVSRGWEEIGVPRTCQKRHRRTLRSNGFILEDTGPRPGDGQVVNWFCIADIPGFCLMAIDQRLAMIDRSGRTDRFTQHIRKELLRLKAFILGKLGLAHEPDPPSLDDPPLSEPDPLHNEPPLLPEADPLHNNEKRKEFSNENSKEKACSASSLGGSSKITSISTEEAAQRWDKLCEEDEHGGSLRTLAQIMAEKNESGAVSVRRVWRKLGERYLKLRGQLDLTEEAWSYGFEAAIDHEAPNIGYAAKAARGYERNGGEKTRRMAVLLNTLGEEKR
jgi:hypothetical protein